MTDTKFELILEMFFLKISNMNVLFDKKTLIWKSYTTMEALSTIERVQIVNSKKFVIAAFDVDNKTFMVHIAIQKQEKMPVHFKKQA